MCLISVAHSCRLGQPHAAKGRLAARFRGAVADDAFRVLRSPEGREWRCYADTTEAAEADAEEVEEEEWPGMGHRPRRPRGGGGAPGGPYQWMGVSEDRQG